MERTGYYTDSNGTKWRSYPSPGEAIDDFGKLIRDGDFYVKVGNHFVSQIAEHYCPPTASHWAESVNGYLKTAYSKVVDE